MKTMQRTATITITDTYECSGTETTLAEVKAGLEEFVKEYFKCAGTVEVTEQEVAPVNARLQ